MIYSAQLLAFSFVKLTFEMTTVRRQQQTFSTHATHATLPSWRDVILIYWVILKHDQAGTGGSCFTTTQYNTILHAARQWHRWSTPIACRRCSNYTFILGFTPGFNGLEKNTARRDENHLRFGIWCDLYKMFHGRLICCAGYIRGLWEVSVVVIVNISQITGR